MSNLNINEQKIIKDFLAIPIPQYVFDYSDEKFDLLDSYEIAFTFANDLLRGNSINPSKSPWGDGKSVIFDVEYIQLLTNIKNEKLSEDISTYCNLFLSVLNVFKSHLEPSQQSDQSGDG